MDHTIGSWVKNLNLHKEDTAMAGAMIDRAQVFNIMIIGLNGSDWFMIIYENNEYWFC